MVMTSSLSGGLEDIAIVVGVLLYVAIVTFVTFRNFMTRYLTAEPNEWMLVIDNGVQKKAAVGMAHFQQIGETVVKFPSKMHNVNFTAEQVTQEMQGVRLTGFASWTCYRVDDGPYRLYKTFDGMTEEGLQQGNATLQKLVESVLRHMISGCTIDEVMTNRHELRNKAREELLVLTKGWGVWIETVEISDVLIMSSQLFKQMQAEHRQKARLKSETITMKTELELEKKRRENQVSTTKAQELAETQRFKLTQEQSLLRDQQRFETEKKKHELELLKLEQSKKMEVERMLQQKFIQQKSMEEQQKIEQAQQLHQLTMEQEKKRRRTSIERAYFGASK